MFDLPRVLKSAVNVVLGNQDNREGVRIYFFKWLMPMGGNQVGMAYKFQSTKRAGIERKEKRMSLKTVNIDF